MTIELALRPLRNN